MKNKHDYFNAKSKIHWLDKIFGKEKIISPRII